LSEDYFDKNFVLFSIFTVSYNIIHVVCVWGRDKKYGLDYAKSVNMDNAGGKPLA